VDNYYRTLKIEPAASEVEIKKAILNAQRFWNPRVNHSDLARRQEAERMVKLLAEAEQILLNAPRKQQYDMALQTAPAEKPQVQETQNAEVQDWINEGRRFLGSGDIPSALFAATRATQVDGMSSEAWALSAQAKFRWGQIPDAIYEYKRAINLLPNEAKYYFDLGSVYEAVEDWPSALQQFQWAARIEPMTTMYRASVGEMFWHLDRYVEAITTLKQCLSEAPENRIYRELLALAYCFGSYEHWTQVPAHNPIGLPEGQYATTRLQVDEALASVQIAQELHVQTPDVQNLVQSIHTNIQSMLKRHFHGNWFAAGLATFIGLLSFAGSPFLGLLYLVCAVGYAVSCFIPQYLINRRIIAGQSLRPTNFLASVFLEGGVGCTGIIIGLVIILLTLPVLTVVNILRNWVLAPQPTATERQRQAMMPRAQPGPRPEVVINQQQRS
jgi:tetratricopeptide (TPR) repeat protein